MATTDPRVVLATLAKLENLRDPRKVGQRHYQRCMVRGEAILHPLDQGQLDQPAITIQLRDLGWGGLGFLSPVFLAVGSHWRATFTCRGYQVGQQAGLLRYCLEVQEGIYLCGMQFCIEAGVMHMLGVDPQVVADHDRPQDAPPVSAFLAPSEVA